MKIWKKLKAWLCITGEFVGPIKPKDPAPCGDDDLHYYYREQKRWPCPRCLGLAERRREKEEKEKTIKHTAKAVAEELARMQGDKNAKPRIRVKAQIGQRTNN